MANKIKGNKVPLSWKINSIKELGFYHRNPLLLNIKKFDKSKVRFTINAGLNWNSDNSQFEVALKITFIYPQVDKEDPKQLFGIDTLVIYDIKNSDGVIITKKDNTFEIPTRLLLSFFSVAFSTTRGMLTSNILRTSYSDIVLPAIDPKKVLNDLWGDLSKSSKTTISRENRVR